MMSGDIPNRFHFVFGLKPQRQPFHLVHYLCLQSCIQVNRPETIYFYYQHEPYGPYWDAIRPKLCLERVPPNRFVEHFHYQESWIKRFRYAHHADFIRLEKLMERGGVYADIDTLFVRPLTPELYKNAFVLGREWDLFDKKTAKPRRSLCNAFIMCAPGAEFAQRWLAGMSTHFDGSWSNHSTLLPQELADQSPNLIHVEPQRSFYYFPPSSIGLAALFEDKQPIPNDLYSIHLWQHLWWNKTRVDFTDFHQGMITREYVAKKDTTYAVAARPFLPPESVSAPQVRVSHRIGEAVTSFATKVETEFRCLAGLAIYPYTKGIWPRANEGFRLARGHRAHAEASKRFHMRNGIDAAILRTLIGSDEYEIFDERLNADDVVIDVGAHIGAFSWAAHWLGSRNTHAFEAEPSNFALLRRNLAGLTGISLTYGAIFSDVRNLRELTHSGHLFSNTGGGSVMFGHNCFAFEEVGHLKQKREFTTVPVISFDGLLSKFERVRLLKLDCEGSEYPILLNSKCLHKVDRIVGEYHVIDHQQMDRVVPEARVEGFQSYNGETIRELLSKQGFEVTIVPYGELGRFNAVRKRATEYLANKNGNRAPK